ncbi:MAG: peptide chain release factor N(5)-glutamine methyltransferase [Chloroflexi bacterium]|nr:peptide chain release factor N(5)-glutamine methyltransferase [Chloroflexota bacterium]
MNLKNLLETTITRLEPFCDTPQLDAQVLIAHIIQKPRSWVMAHPEFSLTTEQKEQLNDSLMRLERGESFPYVLGKWEFFGLDFDITNDVLIPRPETELLVEKAIAWLQASPERRTVADVGTGSGAIATSIAMHVEDARILATDISLGALKVAQHNARKFHVHHRIDFLQCDLLPQPIANLPTDSHFDLICANLPYIPTQTLQRLPIYGREPTLALDGGADGLEIYRRLFKLAPEWLAPRGMMLLEIESTLGVQALSLAYDSFSDVSIHLHQDLTGRDRLLEITFR